MKQKFLEIIRRNQSSGFSFYAESVELAADVIAYKARPLSGLGETASCGSV